MCQRTNKYKRVETVVFSAQVAVIIYIQCLKYVKMSTSPKPKPLAHIMFCDFFLIYIFFLCLGQGGGGILIVLKNDKL